MECYKKKSIDEFSGYITSQVPRTLDDNAKQLLVIILCNFQLAESAGQIQLYFDNSVSTKIVEGDSDSKIITCMDVKYRN